MTVQLQARPRASAPPQPMKRTLPMLPQQLMCKLHSLQEATTCHTEHAAHTPAQLTAERALRACGGAWAGAARAHLKASRRMPISSAWVEYDLGVLREPQKHLPRAGAQCTQGRSVSDTFDVQFRGRPRSRRISGRERSLAEEPNRGAGARENRLNARAHPPR